MQRYTVELRAEIHGNTLRGHAAVFDSLAKLPAHWERLGRSAFDAVLKSEPDVRALVNHNPSLLLGRTKSGTLRLSTDDTGLQFEVDLGNQSYARDLRESLERGDLTGASFGFVPGEDDWSSAPDGRKLRTHTSVAQLLDVSPVTYPAYGDTDVALRSYTFDPAPPGQPKNLIRARARLILIGETKTHDPR